jgi:LmbE family N-acetylglucosaminyl deacetylase
MAKKVVMVISAHPDDSEFAVAGTVAKWVREGHRVVYVICTNGDKGSDDPKMTSARLAEIREREQREAAGVVGVSEVVFLGHPDGGLEDTPQFRGELVRLIRKYHPDIVMTSDPYHRYMWHRDHRITGIVTLDAVFPYARDRLSYPEHQAEGLEPHKVKEVYLWGSEEPDTFVDIGNTLEIKLKALRCHVSQLGGHSDWKDWVVNRASTVGRAHGIALAEEFRRIEIIY